MIELVCVGCGNVATFPDGTMHAHQPITQWFQTVGRKCANCRPAPSLFTPRPVVPVITAPTSPLVGLDDPMSSLVAMANFTSKRSSIMAKVGQHLLDHVGEWVSKETLREVGGGDSADRRAREFRDPPYNWPVSCEPVDPESNTWRYRLDHLPEESAHVPT